LYFPIAEVWVEEWKSLAGGSQNEPGQKKKRRIAREALRQ
jgi:hypothetical protein